MDVVVLEVEVMRSVMKKREEGSGHRIDDIGVLMIMLVMVMIILRMVVIIEVLVAKCSNAISEVQ